MEVIYNLYFIRLTLKSRYILTELINGVINSIMKMRSPKKNGWLDKKLHNWVVKDINAPIFQVKEFIISLVLFLFVVYGDVLPIVLFLIGLVGCSILIIQFFIKFFVYYYYFDYCNSIYKANGSLIPFE